jgi:hypothetical protein
MELLSALSGVLRFGSCLREGLIAPSPPGVVAVDVEKELSHRPPVR